MWAKNNCPFKDECPMPRDRMIVYRGPLDADIVIVGQSPGAEEYKMGEPFVGPAGQALSQLLAEVGLPEDKILFSNATMCAPTNNETPGAKQLRLCRPNLLKIIQKCPRKLVICLGNEAWASVQQTKASGVTKGAGTVKPFPEGGIGCQSLWTLHPAALLRDPSYRGQIVHDLELAKDIIGGGCPKLDEINYSIYAPGCDELPSLDEIASSPYLVYDVETTGLDWLKDELLGVGIGWEGQDGNPQYAYIALKEGDPPYPIWDGKDTEEWLQLVFTQHVPDLVIAHNMKFDAKMVAANLGVRPPIGPDVMVMGAHVDENRPHGLKESANFYLDAPAWDILWKDKDGKPLATYRDRKGLHLGMVPAEEVGRYCCYDCHYTLRLYQEYLMRMTKKQLALYRAMQIPQSEALFDMEIRGIKVDRDSLQKAFQQLNDEIAKIEEAINEASGFADSTIPCRNDNQVGINIRSTNDLQYLLYDHFGLADVMDDVKWKTKTGITVNEEALVYLRELPFISKKAKQLIELILRHRGLSKLSNTYIRGLLERSETDGHIHSTFTQHVTETGRLSSRDPNLQNIPKSARPFFIADEGRIFVDADYSNIEISVWAHYSQDPTLISLVTPDPNKSDEENDFHRNTAAIVFNKDPVDITEDERNRSKVIVFGGVMYGGGAKIIAEQTGLSIAAATELYQRFCDIFSVGVRWLHGQVQFARENGYIVSDLGRIRRLPAINSSDDTLRSGAERQAMNTVIQSTAADITNIALVRLHECFTEGKGRDTSAFLVNTVHDSIVVECAVEEADIVKQLMNEIMTAQPYRGFELPLSVDFETSKRWGGEMDWDKLLEV